MSAIIEITRKIRIGEVLQTPSGRARFEVYHIDPDRVMIRVGRKETLLTIPSSCFDAARDYLKGKGWVRIGAVHGVADDRTLERCLQRFTHGTSAASYVAPILEKSGIFEIDRRRPARIRLRT